MQQKPGTGSSFVSRPKETIVNPKSKRRASYPRTRAGSSKVPKMSEENVQQENSNIPHDDETVAQGLKAQEERSVDSDDAVSQEDEDVEMESEKDATESEEERDPEEVAREAREAAEAAAATHKEAGNKKFKSQDYYGAIDCYTNAINAYPEGSVYYLNRAAARMMVSQFDRAAEDCKECIKLDPNNLKAHLRLGKTLLKRGRLDESIAAFQQALLRDPTNGEALEDKKQARLTIERISRARQLLDEKNFSTALHMVSAGLRVSPDSRQLNLLKAEALVGQGEYDQAYALTTKLMRDSQDDNALLFVRARILYYQENFANAIKHLQQALRSDPDNRKFSNEIKRVRKLERLKESGNAAFKSGRLQEAVEVYGECLQVDPAHKSFCSKLYCNRAAALSKMGRNEEALQDCDKAIELNKEYAKAYNRRAQCLRALGGKENLDRALFDYQQVEQLLGRSREIQQAIRDTKLELKKAKRKDYYGILGLTNRERSTEAEIKKAYKKSALKWHPDRHAGKSEEDAAKAEANFKDVSEAYTLLSDPQKKEQYDQGYDLEEIEQGGGHSHGFGGHGMGGVDPNDIFRMFFGGGGGGVHFG